MLPVICCVLPTNRLDSTDALALKLFEYRHQEAETYWLYQQAVVNPEEKTSDVVNQEEKTSAVVSLKGTPNYVDEVSPEDLLDVPLRCCSI